MHIESFIHTKVSLISGFLLPCQFEFTCITVKECRHRQYARLWAKFFYSWICFSRFEYHYVQFEKGLPPLWWFKESKFLEEIILPIWTTVILFIYPKLLAQNPFSCTFGVLLLACLVLLTAPSCILPLSEHCNSQGIRNHSCLCLFCMVAPNSFVRRKDLVMYSGMQGNLSWQDQVTEYQIC